MPASLSWSVLHKLSHFTHSQKTYKDIKHFVITCLKCIIITWTFRKTNTLLHIRSHCERRSDCIRWIAAETLPVEIIRISSFRKSIGNLWEQYATSLTVNGLSAESRIWLNRGDYSLRQMKTQNPAGADLLNIKHFSVKLWACMTLKICFLESDISRWLITNRGR